MKFFYHPKFTEELDGFINKSCAAEASSELTMQHIENLLAEQFDGMTVLTPKNIGGAKGFGAYDVYWLKMYIPNSQLRRKQHPKCYFWKFEGKIYFLCLDSHITNYKDSKLRIIALKRLKELESIHSCKNKSENGSL